MQPETDQQTREQLERLPSQFAAALNDRNVEAFDEFVSSEYVNHNRYAGPGRQGVKDVFTEWLDAFSDVEVTVQDVFADVDRTTVVGRITYDATHTSEYMGIHPTKEPVQMTSIDIWRVEDGKFIEHWDELNMLEFVSQLEGGTSADDDDDGSQ